MKTKLLIAAMFASCALLAQRKETDASEWTVTKINNQNQLLNNPNEITVGPDGWLWVTERSNRLDGNTIDSERVVRVNPSSGVKEVMLDLDSKVFSNAGQDGLMGMAIDPSLYVNINDTSSPYIWVAYTYDSGNNGSDTYTADLKRELRIERYTYRASTNDFDPNSGLTIIDGLPASNDHNSGRLKLGPDNKLYYTMGDLGYNQFANKCSRIQSQALPTQAEVNAQDYKDYKGKILRLNPNNGDVPSDNPLFLPHDVVLNDSDYTFSDQDASGTKVRSHIYTYGHRNAQGIIFGADGTLYSSEHGDRVDDEVNIITAGGNYGWPFVVGDRDGLGFVHCRKESICGLNNGFENGDYNRFNECDFRDSNGNLIAASQKYPELSIPRPSNLIDPIANYNSGADSNPEGGFRTWPSVAPSSIDIYEGNIIPWGKSILVPSLKSGSIYRYELDETGQAVTGEFTIFHSSVDRYRDLAVAPDGKTIYAIIDSGGKTSGPSNDLNGLDLDNPGAIIKFEYNPLPYELYISEVAHPTSADGNFIEIYNYGTTAINFNDENIRLGRQRSGNSADTEELKLSGTIQPGQYFVIGRSTFTTAYPGIGAPNQVGSDGLLGSDGDDPYALVYGGTFSSNNYTVIDTYGVLGVDGTDEDWDFTGNIRATRARLQPKNNSLFDVSEWTLSAAGSVVANNTPFTAEPLDFIYASNAITPFDPTGVSTHVDNLQVQDGTYTMTDQLVFKNVTISNGATLEFSNKTLLVAKDFTNSGSITGSDKKIRFTNDNDHTISGNDFEIESLVTNSSLQINATVSIKELLKVTSGDVTIASDEKLILKSTAAGTAFVEQVPVGSAITGDVMVERYIPAKRAFRFITSPVTTTTSIYDNWQEGGSDAPNFGTDITGSSTGANGFDITPSGNPSLYAFNNASQQWTAVDNTNNNTIEAGIAYRLLVRGDRTVDLTDNETAATNTTLRTTGTLKTQDYAVPSLNATAGSYNFVGNPYQAPVDLEALLARSNGVNKQDVYLWDPTVNDRGVYVAVDVINNTRTITGSNVRKFLQPNTGFFVVTTGASPSIAFAEADKDIDQEILSVYNTSSILRVSLNKRNIDGTAQNVDGVLAYFDDAYDAGIDYSDSYKFSNQDENLYFLNNGSKLSIDRRPPLVEGLMMPVAMNNMRGQSYSLEINASSVAQQLYLYDAVAQTYIDIEQSGTTIVDFDLEVGEDALQDRFFIASSKSTLSTTTVDATSLQVYPNPYRGELMTIKSPAEVLSIKVTNMLGQQVWYNDDLGSNGSTTQVQLPASIVTGTYVITIETNEGRVNKKLLVE